MSAMTEPDAPRATATTDAQRVHPRPQLIRPDWLELAGPWGFAFDDADDGRAQRWFDDASTIKDTITVPYPPESAASGVADTGFHPVVWYQREITLSDVAAAGRGRQGSRVLVHFGAVDYVADVWLAGYFLGHHEGGHTPFSFDITDVLERLPQRESWSLVVRAADDPHDVAQPRGKQDWQSDPHGIWYQRTTGIWQPVWLEALPVVAIADIAWSSDLTSGSVEMSLELTNRPMGTVTVEVALEFAGECLAKVTFTQSNPRSRTVIHVPGQANGQEYETLLWSPEHPRLISASVEIRDGQGHTDAVRSYFGLRSVGWSAGHFLLNDRPYYLRAVLAQGYWPATHLAAPGPEAIEREVRLIKELGFNSVRVHQKVEDPRFLYWADQLGVLVWGESASAYEFSTTAVERMTREWLDVVRRDRSHPCIMAWVPINESWGVQHISHDPAQLHYAQMLYHLTKALDPTRPVISNDGWEHADSDIWTIHDYGATGAEVAANYVDRAAMDGLMAGIGPLGRRMKLLDVPDRGQPIIVSEFGGVSYAPQHVDAPWGYVTANDSEEFERHIRDMFEAVQNSPVLAGFCYTQLTDTLQEANGLADPLRRPKLPVALLRSIVEGDAVDTSAHRRPKTPVERLTSQARDDARVPPPATDGDAAVPAVR